MSVIERPADVESEQAVLGSLICDPTAIISIAQVLKPEDFYTVHHGWIYTAILELGVNTDVMTLRQKLIEAGKWAECGEDAYIAQLQASYATALNVQQYAANVKRKALARRLLDTLSAIAIDAQNPALDTDALVDRTQSNIIRALSDAVIKQPISLDAAIDAFYGDFSNMLETGIVPGIPTGIPEFDFMVGGWKSARLTVIGALPGHGKTTLMLNSLISAARKGHRCAFLSLEMKEQDLIESIISNMAGVDISPVSVLKLKPAEREDANARVIHALATLRQLPIHLIYAPSASPADMVYECKRLGARYGHIELAAFDYIQLGRPSVQSKQANREQDVSAIALGLKQAAGELDCHILTGSQVNEQGDTRESRAITQHADTVIYLKREDNTIQLNMMPITAEFWKNRKGKTGPVNLMFNKPMQRITGVSK